MYTHMCTGVFSMACFTASHANMAAHNRCKPDNANCKANLDDSYTLTRKYRLRRNHVSHRRGIHVILVMVSMNVGTKVWEN